MKKIATIGLVIVGLLFSGMAYANWMGGYGGYGMHTGQSTNIDNLKKFQKETLSLRDEIVTKNYEIGNEYAKSTPDYSKIATLEKEIVDLRTKIDQAADKYGITGPEYMAGMHGFGGMMGYGPGPNGNYMAGYNRCWQ